jgi:glycerate kinase
MTAHPRAGHVVVASDKFKGSLTAGQVAAAITAGLVDGVPDVEVRTVVVADGGDGTLEAVEAAGFAPVPVACSGPTGEPVASSYAVRDGVAVVEMADACGLIRLPGGRLDPMTASSRGLGEVIAVALDAGLRRVVIGIGGSASTDGGAGMVQALGARLLDSGGGELAPGGGALRDLATIDLSGLHPALAASQITVACDVDNPLTGPMGAAAVFAPQKGASPAQVAELDAGLGRLAAVVAAQTGRDETATPGAGAAGGVGWAALAVLGARMRPGIALVLELAGFDALLDGARLVVTGEGSLDRQTLLGKAPAGVARAARAAGVPVVAVCGRSLLDDAEAEQAGIAAVYALTELEPDPQVCMRDAGPLLRRLSAEVARQHLAAD